MWTYTTARELTAALEACGQLLERVLPAIEQQCQQLLLPPPAALPSAIIQHGPLSARQAYDVTRSGADQWASDAELDTVSSSSQMALRRQIGEASPSIDENGRVTAHGGWGFKFLSKRLDCYCLYQVPHTGRIW